MCTFAYQYDAFGRTVRISTRGESARLIAEYRYTGLNQRIAWHYDCSRAYVWYQPDAEFYPDYWEVDYGSMGPNGTLDADDPWFTFVYDERWRMLATYRERTSYEYSVPSSEAGYLNKREYLDAQGWAKPKEVFYNHQAGLSGLGGSSYIDMVIRADRDEVLSGESGLTVAYFYQPVNGSEFVTTLNQKWLVLQNWRADVVAITSTSGWLISSTRYSSYGVPYDLSRTDHGGDGVTNIDDIFIFLNDWFASCTAPGTPQASCSNNADFNRNNTINIDDIFIFLNAWFGDIGTSYGSLRTGLRKGYAGYENDGIVSRLYHVRHRVLDVELGRWMRRDPLGYVDGMGLYEYAKCRPVRFVDSLGLFACSQSPCSIPDPGNLTPDGACEAMERAGCAYNSGGGVICMNGRHVPCAWVPRPQPVSPGGDLGAKVLADCIKHHERDHYDVVDCTTCVPGTICRPLFPPGFGPDDIRKEECAAARKEIQCLWNASERCDSLSGVERDACKLAVRDRIKQLCAYARSPRDPNDPRYSNPYYCSGASLPECAGVK